jgi:hypothetical protein
LVVGVQEWVTKKFRRNDKQALMQRLWPGNWSSELVVNNVKSLEELDLIKAQGVLVHQLQDIVHALGTERFIVPSAAGADFIDLIQIGAQTSQHSITR